AIRKEFLSVREGVKGEGFAVDRYVCNYRTNRPSTLLERARLERVAAMALRVCEEILSAEHPEVLDSAQPIESVEVELDLSLAGLSDREAARIWGRGLAAAVNDTVSKARIWPAPARVLARGPARHAREGVLYFLRSSRADAVSGAQILAQRAIARQAVPARVPEAVTIPELGITKEFTIAKSGPHNLGAVFMTVSGKIALNGRLRCGEPSTRV